MVIAELFTNSLNMEATLMSVTDEWISNMRSIHIMEYSSFLKRKVILTNVIKNNPEDVRVSEIGHKRQIP